MTAQTPAFAIKYPVQGEPIRTTRQILEDNAKAIEAALLSRALAPPAAVDLAAAIARFAKLEPAAWTPATLAAPHTTVAGYRLPQYRLVGDTVELRGVIGTTSTAGNTVVLFTLPSNMRPLATEVFSYTSDALTYGRFDVNPDGTVIHRAGSSGYVSLSGARFSVL